MFHKPNAQINIKEYLPHLPPMLMVDMIEEMCQERVRTHFTIQEDCIFLDNGYLSETGLIENAAQTCSAISGQHYYADDDEGIPKVLGFISSIKHIEIFQLPRIGTKIESKAELISLMQTDQYSICTLKVTILEGDVIFLKGQMNLFLRKEPHEEK